jgi:hypothetical protein
MAMSARPPRPPPRPALKAIFEVTGSFLVDCVAVDVELLFDLVAVADVVVTVEKTGVCVETGADSPMTV